MRPGTKSLEALRETFARKFRRFDLRLPEENLHERRRGSLPYGSGRLFYLFGEEDDNREYLEFYAHHRMGDDHARIYEDGVYVDLPALESGFCYNPDLPGDEERQRAEMEQEYRAILDDLVTRGLFEEGSVPNALAINSHLVLRGKDADGGVSSEESPLMPGLHRSDA